MTDFKHRLERAILEARKWSGPAALPPMNLSISAAASGFNKRALQGAALGLAGCGLSIDGNPTVTTTPDDRNHRHLLDQSFPTARSYYPATVNGAFEVTDRETTPEDLANRYNNFYEFTVFKDQVCRLTSEFQTYPWNLEVSGLVENPQTFSLDQLVEMMPLEERLYRFRCVEAWSMVVPWVGFTLQQLLDVVQPTSRRATFDLYRPRNHAGYRRTGKLPVALLGRSSS